MKFDPSLYANKIKKQLSKEFKKIDFPVNIVGLLGTNDPAAIKYVEYTKKACIEVGVNFSLKSILAEDIKLQIEKLNKDKSVHGIFIYYPIFNSDEDEILKNLVSPHKDIEGLNHYWIKNIYSSSDVKQVFSENIIPCTPKAIITTLSEVSELKHKNIVIFNRSEVVGKPLAHLLSLMGNHVFSFDDKNCIEFILGQQESTFISRQEALEKADIIITGVPNKNFNKIKANEFNQGVIGLNFSSFSNFEESSIAKMKVYIPRVGPLTVAMVLKNTLSLVGNV